MSIANHVLRNDANGQYLYYSCAKKAELLGMMTGHGLETTANFIIKFTLCIKTKKYLIRVTHFFLKFFSNKYLFSYICPRF